MSLSVLSQPLSVCRCNSIRTSVLLSVSPLYISASALSQPISFPFSLCPSICDCSCLRLSLSLSGSPADALRLKDLDDDAMSVCGGFSETYKSMCDYYQTPVREDICWDITHLFPANNITEFNVEDLEQPVSSIELAGLIGAMRFNKYFTGFVARHIQLDTKRTFADIGAMLKGNTTINKLVLSNVGMSKDAGMAVADGLKVRLP